MTPDIKIEVPLPGEKLFRRFLETVAVLRPFGRALADGRREDALILAQTERDVEDIRSGRKSFDADYQLVERHEPASPLAVVHRNRIAQEVRSEVNVSKALLRAEAELEDDPQTPPDRTVDEDWLFRWRDAAGTVSTEDLQTLWGRVLAGEIKSPGSFSLRTLEFLKNISQKEAREITKLAPFVLDNDFIFRGANKLFDAEGITFGFLLYLQNLGITCGVDAAGLSVEIGHGYPDRFQKVLISYDRALLVTHEDASKKLKLEIYGLTPLGKQIFKLGSFTPHEIYLREIGQIICQQGFNVSLARWKDDTETSGRYFEPQDICAKSV